MEMAVVTTVEDLGLRKVGHEWRSVQMIRTDGLEETKSFGFDEDEECRLVSRTETDYGPGRAGGVTRVSSWVPNRDISDEERARNRENIYRAVDQVISRLCGR